MDSPILDSQLGNLVVLPVLPVLPQFDQPTQVNWALMHDIGGQHPQQMLYFLGRLWSWAINSTSFHMCIYDVCTHFCVYVSNEYL